MSKRMKGLAAEIAIFVGLAAFLCPFAVSLGEPNRARCAGKMCFTQLTLCKRTLI